MTIKPILHGHAVDRIQERFGLDESWLLEVLDSGRFVWLKGSGNSGTAKRVRSEHLIFLPDKDEYCVVVMDDRKRLAITVLTEEMARNSPWGIGLDATAKLRAKRIALNEEIVDDSNFLRLYAEERGILSLKLILRTFTNDWQPTVFTLCRVEIAAEQIDPQMKICTLTPIQEQEATKCVSRKIENGEIRPYCDLYVESGKGKKVSATNKLAGTFGLEDGELARRWNRDFPD